MMIRRVWTLAALACVLLVSACDGGDAASTASPRAAETTPTPAAIATPEPNLKPASSFAELVAGTDYELVDPAPPKANSGTPITVAEAFSYACSHCAHFEPQLAAWVAKLPADVAFEAVPMPLSDVWTEFARAHYAAVDLGLTARTHAALFEAIHTQGARIDSVDALVQWFADNSDVEATAFRAAMTSAGTDARIDGARARALRWGIESTPTLIVGDRYRVPGFANAEGGFARTLAVADLLLAEARQSRTPAP